MCDRIKWHINHLCGVHNVTHIRQVHDMRLTTTSNVNLLSNNKCIFSVDWRNFPLTFTSRKKSFSFTSNCMPLTMADSDFQFYPTVWADFHELIALIRCCTQIELFTMQIFLSTLNIFSFILFSIFLLFFLSRRFHTSRCNGKIDGWWIS